MKIQKLLGVNTNLIRIREFQFSGQKFKVKVPNVAEAEAMEDRVNNPPEDQIKLKYDVLTKPLLEKKGLIDQEQIKILEDDIIVGDKSLKELATNQVKTELRILESFKLLIPIDDEDLSNITYDDINKEIPFPIQLDLVKKIASIISPSYEESKKN